MRRSGLALLASGALAVAGALAPLAAVQAADAEPGSALGAYVTSAKADAVQVRFRESAYCFGSAAGKNGCELVLPEATSTLRSGPIGSSLAAVAWPGDLAANIGSLLVTASNGQVPDQARMLNDPVRAENQTNGPKDTVTYDGAPGTTMIAVAKEFVTSAEAAVSSTQATPAGTFGRSESTTKTYVDGPGKAVSVAHASVQDISLAGGLIKIASVTSDATATTDGAKATATGKTVVSGMTINSVPVTIGDNGITVAGQGVGLGPATAAVNTVVNNLGLKVVQGAPTASTNGSAATYNPGSLVLLWEPQAGYQLTVELGGVSVQVDADPALDFSTPGVDTPVTDPGIPSTPSGSSGFVPSGSGSAPIDSGSAPVTGGSVPTTPSSNPVVAAPPTVRASFALPDGTSPWLGALGVAGVGLMLAGLRRLPDRVLVPTAPECLLEENR